MARKYRVFRKITPPGSGRSVSHVPQKNTRGFLRNSVNFRRFEIRAGTEKFRKKKPRFRVFFYGTESDEGGFIAEHPVYFLVLFRGRFHNIIQPNLYVRVYPDGNVLYSIRVSLTAGFLVQVLFSFKLKSPLTKYPNISG